MLRTSTIRRFSFINSRAHEGRDILFLLPARFSNRFNSRAREGRDLVTFAKRGVKLSKFQLTRPRGARQFLHSLCNLIKVSTHAPARGATGQHDGGHVLRWVSTHAPARGATAQGGYDVARCCFNSRAREGRDLTPSRQLLASKRFQLTRPRGARLTPTAFDKRNLVFQLTRPRGARLLVFIIVSGFERFQLTRPRGARPTSPPATFARSCFNSRAREGRDVPCVR